MKRKGHKHKESFSVLLISNTGRCNRKFYISRNAICAISILLILICVGLGLTGWLLYRAAIDGSGSKEIQAKLDEQIQLNAQLEADKQSLSEANTALEKENEELRLSNETEEVVVVEEVKDEEDLSIPRRYPSSSSAVLSFYTEEQPYLSINTHKDSNVIATGSGTVTEVTSDDTYAVIVEIEHKKGYKSKYMCRQEVNIAAASIGAQVEAGDSLFTITEDDTQLDYQIIFEEEPIDPLTVIEAKG
ncbi:MAG: M23 family metallopeptidase [Clostridiales bacterium]|nr:M23 family metallopeptidase [Clostridiales bacterium]